MIKHSRMIITCLCFACFSFCFYLPFQSNLHANEGTSCCCPVDVCDCSSDTNPCCSYSPTPHDMSTITFSSIPCSGNSGLTLYSLQSQLILSFPLVMPSYSAPYLHIISGPPIATSITLDLLERPPQSS